MISSTFQSRRVNENNCKNIFVFFFRTFNLLAKYYFFAFISIIVIPTDLYALKCSKVSKNFVDKITFQSADNITVWSWLLDSSEAVQYFQNGRFFCQWPISEKTSIINNTPKHNTSYYCSINNEVSGCTKYKTFTTNNRNTNLFSSDTINACGSSYTLDAGPGYTSYQWNTGATTQTINITSSGLYNCTVTLGSTIYKDSVYVSLLNANILNHDTSICNGSSVRLIATSSNYYSWSPSIGLDNPNSLNPLATPHDTTTYYLTSHFTLRNLITNPGFESGNSGFTSSYNSVAVNLHEGEYTVSNSPHSWNPGFYTCTDHTSGSGNMLLINGATIPNVSIYCQTVSVNPNTNYAFSAWLSSMNAVNPAMLQFSINGINLGNVFQGSSTSCTWNEFYTIWNSGNNTTASICIVNQNNFAAGNDFALDDLGFYELCTSIDSVTINVYHPQANSITQTVCDTLRWHGTLYQSSGVYFYNYTNPDGCLLTDTLHLTVNNTAHSSVSRTVCDTAIWHANVYTTSGIYLYNSTNSSGCSSTDTLYLTVNYGTHNVLNQSACDSFRWHGILYLFSGIYTYAYTNSNGCASSDTLHLTINLSTHFSITQMVCDSFRWHGNLYQTSGVYLYNYTNGSGCMSVDTLHLKINHSANLLVRQMECDSFRWHGNLYQTSGIYLYNYLNAAGCLSTDTLLLTITSPTHRSESIDACQSYNWHGTVYQNTGTYVYRYINGFNCPSVDTLHLFIHSGPSLGLDKSDKICFGANFNLNSLFNLSGFNTINWTFNGTAVPDVAHADEAGVYQLIAGDSNGCADTLLFNLQINPRVISNAGNDTIVQMNVPFQLHGSGGLIYSWSPAGLLSNSSVSSPWANISTTTAFVLTVYDDLGCSDEDAVLVKPLSGPQFYVPNAFTPNADGLNDIFKPIYVGIAELFSFEIYNRYGIKVFETKNNNEGWDGTYKGDQQPSANYVWIIKGRNIDNKIVEKKGNVILIR